MSVYGQSNITVESEIMALAASYLLLYGTLVRQCFESKRYNSEKSAEFYLCEQIFKFVL